MRALNVLSHAPKRALSRLPLRLVAGRLLGAGTWGAQREVHTGMDRYPRVFEAAVGFAQRHIHVGSRPLRILSFGCSTGEECFSLLNYFPAAEIDGCDVNKAVLQVASDRRREGSIRFYFSSEEALREHGPYDIVFCMSSLCLFPDANRVAGEGGKFPFGRFEALLEGIDGALRPGGLLVAYNTSYSVRMTAVGAKYQPVDCDMLPENGFVNKLGRDGRAFSITESRNHTRTPRIVGKDGQFRDEDFTDVLFWKRDGKTFLPPLEMSAELDEARASVLGRYAISDGDVFENKSGLLSTSFEVTVLRDEAGNVYERTRSRRRSFVHNDWLPVKTYTRILPPGAAAHSPSPAESRPATVPTPAL